MANLVARAVGLLTRFVVFVFLCQWRDPGCWGAFHIAFHSAVHPAYIRQYLPVSFYVLIELYTKVSKHPLLKAHRRLEQETRSAVGIATAHRQRLLRLLPAEAQPCQLLQL